MKEAAQTEVSDIGHEVHEVQAESGRKECEGSGTRRGTMATRR